MDSVKSRQSARGKQNFSPLPAAGGHVVTSTALKGDEEEIMEESLKGASPDPSQTLEKLSPGGSLDHFLSSVCMPQVRRRKRSWSVDERIARQYLSPTFGSQRLSGITSPAVEVWLDGLNFTGLLAVTCNRILAVLKSVCAAGRERCWLALSSC